jgi:hypothetical protein
LTYISTCLADGAVGLYAFGESAFASPAADEAGIRTATYGNSAGISLGQASIAGSGGATACRFIGASSGNVSAADIAAQHFGDTFTIEVWIKLATASTAYGIYNSNSGQGPSIGVDSTGHLTVWSKGFAQIGKSVATISDTTTFHHLVWTKATSTNHTYVDGTVSDGTFSNQTIINQNIWFFGVSNDIGAALNATCTMFAMYPTALSPTQILDHFNQGNGIIPRLTKTGTGIIG